jgi:PAS domain S-box-containing protein
MVLDPWLGGRVPFVTLFGGVIVAVWYGGFGPGLLAALLGGVVANYFFVEPRGALGFAQPGELLALGGYFLSSLLIVALGGAMHAARERSEAAAAALDRQNALLAQKDQELGERVAQLQSTETRFRAFMDHSPDCVFIRDEAGRYIFMNRAAEQLFGVSHAQWKGKLPGDLLPPETARILREAEQHVLKTRHPFTTDVILPAPGGALYFRSTIFALPEAGGRTYLGSIATDITDRTRSEQALQSAQKQLQTVTDTLPVAVIWTGIDRRYRWVNPVFAAWLKRAPADVVGVHMNDVLDAKVMDVIRPYLERVERGEQVHYERIAHLPGLGPRWISMVLTPTYDADRKVDGWVTIGTDVHDRKLTEEQLREADRRKDDFLAMLAHELRNPLAPIRNAVAILGRKASHDPELVWSREVIERQVEQMTRLIDDLLDIERISRGKLLIRKELVPLEKVVDMALETSRPHINSAGHRISVIMPSERVAVEADATRLAQVFSNLLNNSARYTESRGSINLTAAVEGGEVFVSVEDNGIGFDPKVADSLFTPFSQLERANAQSVGGLGIGLSLVQGIVHLHGGTVEAHSAGPGQGSQFIVRLPIVAGSSAEMAPPTLIDAEQMVAPGVKVLVADDNRDAADSLHRILVLYGYEVRVCYDGAAALKLGEDFRPRVVILDIGMPGANGYDVARAMREREGNKVTLVAMTGWGQETDRRRALDAGFDYHLTKPVDPGALNELLLEVTSK